MPSDNHQKSENEQWVVHILRGKGPVLVAIVQHASSEKYVHENIADLMLTQNIIFCVLNVLSWQRERPKETEAAASSVKNKFSWTQKAR